MRIYKTEMGFTFGVKKDKVCLFCEHCTDVWYDSHGPYMVICELNKPNQDNHNFDETCEDFLDDYEEVTE